ncbi:LysE family transporter [Candidatus Dependentiae bacterium]|nr:LysE family transporter [Candidatus Dependentiae bacterium]
MEIPFLIKCYLIGILAASGLGPIFVLTFNRSALCGFWKGFATALGACLADSLYFLLGLFGALAVISELRYFMIVLDFIGGVLLIALGMHSLRKVRQVVCVTVECSNNIFFAMSKSFTLTIVNPLVILFFMAVSIQVLPDDVSSLPLSVMLLSSLFVLAGSLTVLSVVGLIANFVGLCITAKRLRFISWVTGMAFILFGLYLFGDFAIQGAKLLKPSFFSSV